MLLVCFFQCFFSTTLLQKKCAVRPSLIVKHLSKNFLFQVIFTMHVEINRVTFSRVISAPNVLTGAPLGLLQVNFSFTLLSINPAIVSLFKMKTKHFSSKFFLFPIFLTSVYYWRNERFVSEFNLPFAIMRAFS